MAPVVGKLIAEHIAHAASTDVHDRWNLRRFKGSCSRVADDPRILNGNQG
jgi:hypothetical protein